MRDVFFSSRANYLCMRDWGQTKRILVESRAKLYLRRSNLGAREAGVREVQTTMSSELEDGNFEHARCVLRVEIELSVPTGLGQTKRILVDSPCDTPSTS